MDASYMTGKCRTQTAAMWSMREFRWIVLFEGF
jgi:hypothetical protein